jgi:ubiquinone/menaquinone biosynthesis C-methylase UbiE
MSLRWAPIDSGVRGFTTPALTANRPCPVCGSLQSRPFLELPDYQFYLDDSNSPKRTTIRDVECDRCFAAFLDPVYTATGFEILFAEAEQSYGASAGRAEEEVSWMAERGLFGDAVTVLDVGCYDCDLLAAMPASIRRTGVDIDPAAIARGQQRLGDLAELVVGDFESFTISRPPDCITMFHVLEHLQRPAHVLARLRTSSHAGTRLIIEVPVLEGPPTSDLVGFFTAHHTTHFSRRSLSNCLARAGWHVVESLQQTHYNGYRVLCEPAEPHSPSAGDPEDTLRIRQALAGWHRAVVQATRATAPLDGTERCLIWGGGMHLEQIYATLPLFRAHPERKYVILDSDPIKHGGTWRGIEICPPDVLEDPDTDGVPLLISSYGDQFEIVEAALDRGVDSDRIVTLYESVHTH